MSWSSGVRVVVWLAGPGRGGVLGGELLGPRPGLGWRSGVVACQAGRCGQVGQPGRGELVGDGLVADADGLLAPPARRRGRARLVLVAAGVGHRVLTFRMLAGVWFGGRGAGCPWRWFRAPRLGVLGFRRRRR